MWKPSEWSDLERALGVQVEGDQLDFKSSLPSKASIRDLAKDAAAMSTGGGVIVIGVDESDGVASDLTPIPLAGAVERVQQVIDANVTPPLAVEISSMSSPADESKGVVVMIIPASWSAPHEYAYRFPARAGATTRYFTEREIEALYVRRWEMQNQTQARVGIEGHRVPPGVRLDFDGQAVGQLRVYVRPAGSVHVPLEPHLSRPLRAATEAAAAAVTPWFHPQFRAKALDSLRDWVPAGATGWRAGSFLQSGPALTIMVGGMYAYGEGFSFNVTINLAGGLEPDAQSDARCSHEHHWIIETMALLGIAGNFFASLPQASLLRIDLELGGLLDSVSWQASQGMAFHSDAPKVTENLYRAGGTFAARDLAQDPRDATRELLDPFMVAILTEGSDLVGWVQTHSY